MTDVAQCDLCYFLIRYPHLLCVVLGIILLPIGIWTLVTDSALSVTGIILSIAGAICFVPAIFYVSVKAFQEKDNRKKSIVF